MGWPARIDGVTGKVQYYEGKAWHDVTFEASAHKATAQQGTLRLSYKDNGIIDNPKYYYQFTLSKFGKDGSLDLLSYDEGDNGLEHFVGKDLQGWCSYGCRTLPPCLWLQTC